MESTVAVVGTGQHGSRHLQALAKNPALTGVFAVDPSPQSLVLAEQRWSSAGGDTRCHFVGSPSDLPKQLDVAVIASDASVRRAAVEQLLDHCKVRYLILEKVLFQAEPDFAAVAHRLESAGTVAVVNCPRRVWPLYGWLRSVLQPPFHIEASGSTWNLASNAIHLLDLGEFLGGGALQSIAPFLDPQAIPGKRPGTFEVTGTLVARFEQALVKLTCHAAGDLPFGVLAQDRNARYLISEADGRVLKQTRAEPGWHPVAETMPAPLQSELTQTIVDRFLATGSSGLASYEASTRLHLPLLRVLRQHILGEASGPCPIT